MARLMSTARLLERMFQPPPVSAQAALLRSPPWHAPHTASHALTLYNLEPPPLLYTPDPGHPLHHPTDSAVHHPTKVQLTYVVVDDTLNPAHLPDQRSASRIPHPPPPPSPSSSPPPLILSFRCKHVIIVAAAAPRLCQVIRGAPCLLPPAQVIHPDHSKFTRATDN